MTYNNFLALCAAATECNSFEQYAAECGGSCPPECFSEDDGADLAVELLQFCWEYGRNRSFATIHRLSSLSQAAFARAYGMPLRTIEAWIHDVRTAPPYVTDLLAFAVCCNTVFPSD